MLPKVHDLRQPIVHYHSKNLNSQLSKLVPQEQEEVVRTKIPLEILHTKTVTSPLSPYKNNLNRLEKTSNRRSVDFSYFENRKKR